MPAYTTERVTPVPAPLMIRTWLVGSKITLPMTLGCVMGVGVADHVTVARSKMYAALVAGVVKPAKSSEHPPAESTYRTALQTIQIRIGKRVIDE